MPPPDFRIGATPRRLEDERLLRGEGRYLDDSDRTDQVHAVFLRSPHAHARIARLDGDRARRLPGVLAVLTADDAEQDGLGALEPTVRENPHTGKAFRYRAQPLLAGDRVRHVGELVAVIIARTAALALDAADAVDVDYEPLPAVIDVAGATRADAPALFDEVPGNVCLDTRLGDAAATDAAFDGAAHVVSIEVVNHRVITNAMEPRGAVARFDPATRRYELHASTQNVHGVRDHVAEALGVESGDVRLFTQDVGGGFGKRNFAYPEYALLLWAARRIRRTVRWVATRSEGFQSDHTARDFRARASLATDARGRFLALRIDSEANVGAWLAGAGCGIHTGQYACAPGGMYRIAAVSLHIRAVLTNTVPVGVTRGPGFAEAIDVIERLVDRAAGVLGMCRFELRRMNLIDTADLPWTNAMGTRIDSGRFRECLDAALDRADVAQFEARRAAAAERGRWLGLGAACHVKATGGLPEENVNLAFEDDAVVLTTGTMAIGQGHETSFRQILASLLGLAPDQIRYRAGDSDLIAMGGGHGSSRATYMAGTAMARAVDAVVERGVAIAARVLDVDADAVRFEEGLFRVRGTNRSATLLDIARHARDGGGSLDTYQHVTREAMTFPGGCHVAEVAIDPQTGRVALERYTAVDDYGVQVNPMLVRGQMHGAIAQGVGQGLLEHALYDASGQILTGSFMDYALPRADDLPAFDTDTLTSRCTTNPLGVKGCGEAGAVAGFPAVGNAVEHALRFHGVAPPAMPVTAESIWRAIRETRR